MTYDNTNRGALFGNERREADFRPGLSAEYQPFECKIAPVKGFTLTRRRTGSS
jgi:hypothetical protein